MKRMVGLLLSVILGCFYPVTVFSADQEEYITVPVLALNSIYDRDLELMIKNEEVYVEAEMLANWLGFQFEGDEECISIYDAENLELSVRSTQFFYDTAKVKHRLFSQMTDVYEAPFPSIRNDKGFWVPLEYSLLILNCRNWITEKGMIVEMPRKDSMDYFYEIMVHADPYHFDWYQDFSIWLGDERIEPDISEARIRMLNGLLKEEGNLWPSSFQAYAMDFLEYEKKYAENLSLFLCSGFGSERMTAAEKAGSYGEILSEIEKNKGKISDWDLFFLSAQLDFLDTSESNCALTERMKQSMRGYLSALSGDVERYSLIQDFNSTLGEDAAGLFPIKEWKGIQGNDVLPASVALRHNMPLPDEIGKDSRMNILYLQAFQDDVFWNFQKLYQKMSEDPQTVRPAELYRLSQYCYIYLMSSFAARSAALEIWMDKMELTIPQNLVKEQMYRNTDILTAVYNIAPADKTNEDGLYGFLPSDNVEYLQNYDSGKLIAYIESVK